MYYFIVNPVSGCGRGKKVWKLVQRELAEMQVEYEAFVLSYPGEARKIAAGLSRLTHPFTLVVVGGDGTLNEVVDGLSTYQSVTLGCIPTGSGNDFVRGLGLTKEPAEALHAILKPSAIQKIKIGRVRTEHRDTAPAPGSPQVRHSAPSAGAARIFRRTSASFAVSAGIGFDAAVCHSVNGSSLKNLLNWFHLGKLVYTGIALRNLIAMRPRAMKLEIDGKRELVFQKVIFAAVMNLPCEGGGFFFAPDAQPEGDDFTLCIAEGISLPRILTILPLAFSGKHVGKRGVHLIPCRRITIHTQTPQWVHTDGDDVCELDTISVEARPERLAVITK